MATSHAPCLSAAASYVSAKPRGPSETRSLGQCRRGAHVRARASENAERTSPKHDPSRRQLLSGAIAGGLGLGLGLEVPSALATPTFSPPPPGFRLYVDRFDGYSLFVPDSWLEVRGAGQDCFFRSPAALDENISVDVSSPSSSRYFDITDLGSPEEAGKKLLKQYVTEFMSTRLGVRREPTLVRTDFRTTVDGDNYYEVELNVKSFANNNQMAVRPEERITMLEWDRHYITVLGVANNRLYQLRAQVPEKVLAEQLPLLRQILNSFQVFEVLSI